MTLEQFCEEHSLEYPQDDRKFTIKAASFDEAALFYAMTPEEDQRLGCIGHVRMDFGHRGQEFWHTWWPRGPEELNSPEFKAELQEVVDELRTSILKDLAGMTKYCWGHGGEVGGWPANYGYIVETENYRYCLRCNPVPGDYQAYQELSVEGTHEPIITREMWDTVVSIDQKKVRKSPTADNIKSIFTGLVYCADCGFKMRNHTEKFTYKDGTPGRYSSFICGNYARSGRGACTIHTVYENVLTQLVLMDIREKARYADCDPERVAQQIVRIKDREAHSLLASCEKELRLSIARLAELEKLMQNLYEDKYNGTIPQTVFQTLMRKYEAERVEKAEAIPELEHKVKSNRENRQDATRWTHIIRRYTEITELDETILFELVDRIEVGDTQVINGQRICDIKVYYRYVGNVDEALAEERQMRYDEAV